MTGLTFITGNPHKAEFLEKWLGLPIAHHKLELDEIQSLDLHEVAEHKARQAYAIMKKPVLIEDASLSFTAMGRLPGTYIKWFIEEIGYDGLRTLAKGLPHRRAIGRVCYALYDGSELHFFDGEMRGSISAEARGSGGFGFDPVFINEGDTRTRAELPEDEYAATSYRTKAMHKLREFLRVQ